MESYSWTQILPLSEAERKIDLAGIHTLYESWRTAKSRLQKSSPQGLRDFNTRLIRRLSVETGILERLYDLDRGTTEALVTTGFLENIVSHSSTNIEPSRLIEILKSQEAAISLVVDCVAKNRFLTKSLIHELHLILTKNQDTTTAVDQFGTRMQIPLLKGKYKEQPNNPKSEDGPAHEYCPPIHVESEMDNLLGWLREYDSDDPVIVASWLHHRFTQIHPYQDGNGRVARAITTLVLLRADLLPLIVDRDIRENYLSVLNEADRGDLAKLCKLFAELERSAILQALSVDADAEISERKTLTEAVIDSLGQRYRKSRLERNAELRRANDIAIRLRSESRELLAQAFHAVSNSVQGFATPEIHFTEGGPEKNNQHWYKFEVTKIARIDNKFVNFSEDHYFIKSTLRIDNDRLVLVVSFHHVGRDLTGIMEATSFSRLETYDETEDRQATSVDFFSCSLEPFVFTNKTTYENIEDSFRHWLDAAIAVALKEFSDRL